MGIGAKINTAKEETIKKVENNNIIFNSRQPLYYLDNLILPRKIKNKILDIASYAENSNLVFKTWGLESTHKFSRKIGINLWGPPGTGKTMAAHAIANYLNRKILIVNYADIESKYVGETPKNICKAFEKAKMDNSILFFDEADAILSRRVTNMSHSTDVSVNQTRSVMLMLLNDYQDIVIFATNFIENFDPAFMRRILMHIKFELPDEECRHLLWQKYIPRLMPNDFDISYISKKYDGLSGSDISNAVLSAAFTAARNKQEIVKQENLEEAIKNILDSKKANEKEKVSVTTRKVSEDYVKSQIKISNGDE